MRRASCRAPTSSGTLALTLIYLVVNVGYIFSLTPARDGRRDAHRREGDDDADRPVRRDRSSPPSSSSRRWAATSPARWRCRARATRWRSTACSSDPVAVVHPRYRTPHVAIAVTCVWSALLAVSGSYDQLFTYVTFASVLFSTLGRRRDLPAAPHARVACRARTRRGAIRWVPGAVRRRLRPAGRQHADGAARRVAAGPRAGRDGAAGVLVLECRQRQATRCRHIGDRQ